MYASYCTVRCDGHVHPTILYGRTWHDLFVFSMHSTVMYKPMQGSGHDLFVFSMRKRSYSTARPTYVVTAKAPAQHKLDALYHNEVFDKKFTPTCVDTCWGPCSKNTNGTVLGPGVLYCSNFNKVGLWVSGNIDLIYSTDFTSWVIFKCSLHQQLSHFSIFTTRQKRVTIRGISI